MATAVGLASPQSGARSYACAAAAAAAAAAHARSGHAVHRT